MENRIDAALSDNDRDKVLDFINQIRALLPFLIDLTTEERQSLPKMGDKSRAFVQRSLEMVTQDDSFLPRSFSIEEYRRDVELTFALEPVTLALSKLAELVEDTFIAAGSEGYVGSLLAYQSAKLNGRGTGLDETLDALGQRFARKSKEKPTEKPPEN